MLRAVPGTQKCSNSVRLTAGLLVGPSAKLGACGRHPMKMILTPWVEESGCLILVLSHSPSRETGVSLDLSVLPFISSIKWSSALLVTQTAMCFKMLREA